VIGVDPTSLVPLTPLEDVPDASERFAAVAADWIEDHCGANYFSWSAHAHQAPYALLAQAFTRDELVWLWYHSIFDSELDRRLEQDAPVWKVRHSFWRYGCSRNYSQFCAGYNGLSRLAVNLPGFDVRLSHTRSINTAGWAAHGRDTPFYLDAPFGVLLHYKGAT